MGIIGKLKDNIHDAQAERKKLKALEKAAYEGEKIRIAKAKALKKQRDKVKRAEAAVKRGQSRAKHSTVSTIAKKAKKLASEYEINDEGQIGKKRKSAKKKPVKKTSSKKPVKRKTKRG